MEGGSKCQKLGPHMLSMSDLDQLASAVYATEKHDGEYGIASHLSSQAPEANTLPPIESSGVEIVTESNLQTILKLLFCSNQHHKSCEMSQKSLFSIESRGNDHFLSHDNIKLLTANPNLIGTHLQFPSIPQNNPELIPPSEREKSSLRDLEVASFTCSSSSAYSRPRHSRKNRMRWSRELHEKFINCVDNLGGAEKATPKTILKMMESKGLTIFHVKSHLQKYRAEKYMSERKQGETERTSSDVPLLYMENIMQIKETLQLQLDFQKQLNEQLEGPDPHMFLAQAFRVHGEIEEGAVIYDKATGKSRGYGFITYKHMESTQIALRAPSKLIDGRLAVCNLACEGLTGASTTPDLAQRKLYIGGLSPEITSEMLLNFFGRHGEIEEGSVAYDKDTNESRGFGFVTYKTVEAAKKAIDDPQKVLGGRSIIVKLADTHKGKTVQTQMPASVAPVPLLMTAGYTQPGKAHPGPAPVGYSYPQTMPSYPASSYPSPPTAPAPYPLQSQYQYPPVAMKKEPFGPPAPMGMGGYPYYLPKQ
ncbi:conserved hypothetical protein [Ricinus communis]|uniref:Uncharacterized protein n=1 Tax=Ricinus communis TaxID=3988 RepID=B9SWI5_RICCO|nr:conserved hypothetical protein [Ricinus communis]